MTLLNYAPPFLFWMAGGAILTSYYGPLAALNPFRHLLAMVEAMHFGIQTLLGSGTTYRLLPIATEQSLNAVAGFLGLAGWFALLVAIFVRYGVMEI